MERGGKRWREYQYLEDFPYSGLERWGLGHWPLEMQIQNHNDLPYTSHLTPHTSPTGRDTGGDRAGHLMGEAVGSVGSLTSLSLILPPANLLSLLTLSAYY